MRLEQKSNQLLTQGWKTHSDRIVPSINFSFSLAFDQLAHHNNICAQMDRLFLVPFTISSDDLSRSSGPELAPGLRPEVWRCTSVWVEHEVISLLVSFLIKKMNKKYLEKVFRPTYDSCEVADLLVD